MLGDKKELTANSTKKFQVITETSKNRNAFSPSGTRVLKSNKNPRPKMVVLIIGTLIAARIEPNSKCVFLFLNGKKINPATIPATAVLIKQIKTVPNGVIGINTPIVLGAVNIIAPSTRPRNKPAHGPYNNAPTTIGTKASVILTGPNWI